MSAKSASAEVAVNQSQAAIFKLKFDHFELIFDLLKLTELAAVGRSCKRMQHIVGYYFKTHFDAARLEYASDGINMPFRMWCVNRSRDDFERQIIGLDSYVRRLVFHRLVDIPSKGWSEQWTAEHSTIVPRIECDQFESLTEILLIGVKFTDAGISLINGILSQLETVKIKFQQFVDDRMEFYDKFLQYCTKMRKLCVQATSDAPIIGVDNTWLLRTYPTLECFELTMNDAGPIDELATFFEQNRNIKSFATSAELILSNRNAFKNAALKLEVFSVRFNRTETFHSLRDFWTELQESLSFKQLHVYYFDERESFNQDAANQLTTFTGLTKLFVTGMDLGTDLSQLIHLKQFHIKKPFRITNATILATNLVNLESIHFSYPKFDNIVPFIRHSIKLNQIVIFDYFSSAEDVLALDELNKERSKLTNARKIRIYVEEPFYLTLKWSPYEINWNFLEIKRVSSLNAVNHNFDYNEYGDMAF